MYAEGTYWFFGAVPFWAQALVVIFSLFVAVVVAIKKGWATPTKIVGLVSIATIILTAGWIITRGKPFFTFLGLGYWQVQVFVFISGLGFGLVAMLMIDGDNTQKEKRISALKWMVCFSTAIFLGSTLVPVIILSGKLVQWLIAGIPVILWLVSASVRHRLIAFKERIENTSMHFSVRQR
jgi:hypothetical protein